MFDTLVDRAARLARDGHRAIIGICGAPGAGKSTLANAVSDVLGKRAIVVGMDGFHLAQAELERLGRAERKGAPDTFDADGYVHLIRRLRANAGTVYAPLFRRDIEEPIANAVAVPPETPLVITEGNYLLLDEPPWGELRALFDEVWFIAPDESDRMRRLVERHRAYGRSADAALARAHGSDQANAEVVLATASRADLVVSRWE
ncbi:nucleoside/nucleotide kinase family protein [Haloechinothrix salitolerans]